MLRLLPYNLECHSHDKPNNNPMHLSRGQCFAQWSITRRDEVIGAVIRLEIEET